MGFLADIVSEVQASVGRPDYLVGLPQRPDRPPPSLRDAIRAAPGGWAVLLERKHESPGAIRTALPDLPLAQFVGMAEAGGASGLSCLAAGPRFRGSPQEVRALVRSTRLPVLYKDFVVDPIQIEAAHRSGASAVLLIARLETDRILHRPLSELATAAKTAGLEVVLEFHAPSDLAVANRVAADVYGVNLRDLDSLDFRPEVARETFRAATALRPLLGLSGVASREDAVRFRAWGADGILVGAGFAVASNRPEFLQSVVSVGAGPAR